MIEQDGKIKFAVVGCGHIGKRHAEMITRHPETELVALIDVKIKTELEWISIMFLFSLHLRIF